MNKYKLLKFHAEWCAPCRTMKPHVRAAVAAIKTAIVELVESDIDKELTYTEHKVFSVPTIILLKEGKELGRLVGLRGEREILAFLQEHCEKTDE